MQKNKPGRGLSVDFSKDEVPEWIREVIDTSLAIEQEDARSAGSLGFLTRAMVSATMPYKDTKSKFFERRNGDLTLSILSPHGVPHGKYPRLLMSWLVTEAVTTKSNVIVLGDTLAKFLKDVMGLEPTGGVHGTRTRVSEQMKRLFTSVVSVERKDSTGIDRPFSFQNIMIASAGRLDVQDMRRLDSLDVVSPDESAGVANLEEAKLWKDKQIVNAGQWNSEVELTARFFQECIETPVPLDLRAYKALSGAPMAMDIYAWLTYRASYIKRATRPIPWHSLLTQFGSGSPATEQGVRDFKKSFKRNLDVVRIVYPELRVDETSDSGGLILQPGIPHVAKIATSARVSVQKKLF